MNFFSFRNHWEFFEFFYQNFCGKWDFYFFFILLTSCSSLTLRAQFSIKLNFSVSNIFTPCFEQILLLLFLKIMGFWRKKFTEKKTIRNFHPQKKYKNFQSFSYMSTKLLAFLNFPGNKTILFFVPNNLAIRRNSFEKHVLATSFLDSAWTT
jgi:hypothetical protein